MHHHPNDHSTNNLRQSHGNREYLVLVVGHQNVRLLRSTRKSLQPVELPGFPADMKQTLGIDEYPNARNIHTVMHAGRSTQVSLSQYSTH